MAIRARMAVDGQFIIVIMTINGYEWPNGFLMAINGHYWKSDGH